MVTSLLFDNDAGLNIKYRAGMTPFGAPSLRRSDELATAMLARGAFGDVRDEQGIALIDTLRQKGYQDMVALIGAAQISHRATTP